ncbi:MAG: Fur family transcriptional regulator [Pseudomonadota bacterium]
MAHSFEPHDHTNCQAAVLRTVVETCEKNGLRLTPVRRRVLEILLETHQAQSAYDILDTLKQEGFGAAPPVAYRALDFLQTHGFAHKIETRNAYVACTAPGEHHDPAFLICRKCNTVAETEAAGHPAMPGFVTEQVVQEVEGICPNCLSETSQYL